MAMKYNKQEFDVILEKLKSKYEVIGPVLRPEKSFNSSSELIVYDKITKIDDLAWKKKATYSPKEVLFPPAQDCFQFTAETFSEPDIDQKPFLIFMRSCDINGIENLDLMFLKNGGRRDFYYERIRKKCKFILIECNESFKNCFCTAFKTNITSNYSFAVKFTDDEILVSPKKKEFDTYFKDGSYCDHVPKFIEKNIRSINISELKNVSEIYTYEMWRKYDTECMACGRCNAVCISCSCFNTSDILYDDNPAEGKRIRTWVGCHNDDYTTIAGGSAFRDKHGERMRCKTLHKVYYFKKKYGKHMCVGCGRCDDACYKEIKFFDVLTKMFSI